MTTARDVNRYVVNFRDNADAFYKYCNDRFVFEKLRHWQHLLLSHLKMDQFVIFERDYVVSASVSGAETSFEASVGLETNIPVHYTRRSEDKPPRTLALPSQG